MWIPFWDPHLGSRLLGSRLLNCALSNIESLSILRILTVWSRLRISARGRLKAEIASSLVLN
eukprot:scaffold431956_cov13-Prasinocladus_malaysianus.AAC.1